MKNIDKKKVDFIDYMNKKGLTYSKLTDVHGTYGAIYIYLDEYEKWLKKQPHRYYWEHEEEARA